MLSGRNIIITGANRGIGKAVVTACMQARANVWGCVRHLDEETVGWMSTMEEESVGFLHPVELDLRNEESIKEAASTILQEKLPLHGIVNNAGVTGTVQMFSMTSMEDIRDTFQVNFFGPMFFVQRFLKRMIRSKEGSIVNISSIASCDGEPGQFGYVASKAAINGATKKLALELGTFGIRVNGIAPGMTKTDMLMGMENGLMDKTLNRTALGRLGMPEEIASMVVFLLSSRSGFVTGQLIRIDGGCV